MNASNHHTARFLTERGIHVVTAQFAGMSGAEDEDQLHHATMNEWLLTTNRQHFIRLHAEFRSSNKPHGGIVTVPESSNFDRLAFRCAMMLDWITVEFPNQRSHLFRWTDLQQRLISGYVLTGYTDPEIALALGRTTMLP